MLLGMLNLHCTVRNITKANFNLPRVLRMISSKARFHESLCVDSVCCGANNNALKHPGLNASPIEVSISNQFI